MGLHQNIHFDSAPKTADMKTRKRKYTTTILATALLLSAGGCVKDELFITPHPDKGIVAV